MVRSLRDSHPLVTHLDDMVYQLRHYDLDNVGVVTGRERTGKSGFGHLIQCIAEPEWDPHAQCHWGAKLYMRASTKLKPGQTIRFDEATRGGTSMKFMSKENLALADYWTVNGFRNLFHLILYPSLRWMTPVLKEHRAIYNYHALKRYPGSHVVAQIRQLQDEDGVFDRPRVIDTFDVPAPRGKKWELEKALKKEFADQVAAGHADEYDTFQTTVEGMVDRLSIMDP